jgi:hypothetical protein
MKALKYIVGVHKNPANYGVTGRYPLYVNIIT